MVTVPDELLMAYADGELTPEEATALEQLLGQDTTLRNRLEPFVETRLRISYAFEHKLHEPVPDRLIAAIARASAAPAPVAAPASGPPLHQRLGAALSAALAAAFPGGFTPAVAAGTAALLMVGTAVGWIGGRISAPSSLIEVAGSELVASGALAHVLESGPSGIAVDAGAEGAAVMPVLSFRTQTNGVCREYRITGAAGSHDLAGLACRTGEGVWRVALHVETPSAPAGHGPYQTATSLKVPAVDTLTETLISGDAFGRAEEATLLEHGWQETAKPAGKVYSPSGN